MDKITRKELAEIIGYKTLHIKEKDQLTKEIAEYLSSGDHKSIDLNSLMRDVMQYRMQQGVIEAVAVSAHELSSAVIKDINGLLKDRFPDSKSIIIDQKIDESLVGGVRVELPMETLDLSIRSKLSLFKRLVAEERN